MANSLGTLAGHYPPEFLKMAGFIYIIVQGFFLKIVILEEAFLVVFPSFFFLKGYSLPFLSLHSPQETLNSLIRAIGGDLIRDDTSGCWIK